MTDPAAALPVTDRASAKPDGRGYAMALGLLTLGGVVLLLAHGRTWASVAVGGSGLPTVQASFSGSDLNPAGTAVAVLALAGVAGLLATRRVGRLLIGLILVLAGGVSVVTAAQFGIGRPTTLAAGDSLTGIVADRVGVDAVGGSVTVTLWWLVALSGAVLIVTAGLLAVWRSGTWPQLGRRYERADAGTTAAGAPRTERQESAWDQLDRGVDPTVGSGSGPSDTMRTPPVEEDPR